MSPAASEIAVKPIWDWYNIPVEPDLLTAMQEEFRSPLLPYHAGIALLFLGMFATFVWTIARHFEKQHFAIMLARLTGMTNRLKDAERFGHFGSFTWHTDSTKTFWSEEMFNLFDLVPGQKVPPIEKIISMIAAEEREKAGQAIMHAREVPGPFSISFKVMSAGNAMRYIRLDGTTTLAPDKSMLSFEGVAHDITREIEVDRAKSEFVSLASHQLKTPLTAISWLTEALLSGDKGALNEEQRKYIENIHMTDRSMMEMVNDLLNVSRIELGTLQLRPEEIDIAKFAHSVVDEQKKTADDKHISLVLDFEENLPHLQADKNLVKMIFQNLVSNAIKYTPPNGSVKLTIARGTGMRETVFITCADTGIGIPKDEQDKVFEKLHRAKNAQANVPDGTGLGLYVIKTIVERIKGAITFDSIEGKGTTFYVTLPIIWKDSK